MNEDRLKEYKIKLEKERELINKELKEAEQPIDFGTDIDHNDEATDRSEELGNRIAVEQDLKNRLGEIAIAFEKIHARKYGICEQCGKPIEYEILDIDPESRFCKNDKLRK
jgi:DnaK suppressor protein